MKRLLTCDGMTFQNLSIPSFEVNIGDFVGLSVDTSYGEVWHSLIQLLTGTILNHHIQLFGSSSAVGAEEFFGPREELSSSCLLELAVRKGLTHQTATQLITGQGMSPSQKYETVQLTKRILFELMLASMLGTELIVFSAAGLDPLGIRAVAEEASRLSVQAGILELFPASLTSDYLQHNLFSKVLTV